MASLLHENFWGKGSCIIGLLPVETFFLQKLVGAKIHYDKNKKEIKFSQNYLNYQNVLERLQLEYLHRLVYFDFDSFLPF